MRKFCNCGAIALIVGVSLAVIFTGCNNGTQPAGTTTGGTTVVATLPIAASVSTPKGTPLFSHSYSEYPSWSVFGVAGDCGLIDPAAGKMGKLEVKHGVDIELRLLDYDTCMLQYGTSKCDATCITNIDVLKYSLSRTSTATLVTSTSFGADALIAAGVNSLEDLKGQKIYGLDKSVSQYVFIRGCEKKGLNPKDFLFTPRDPGAAAQNFQLRDPDVKAIMVWNPFKLESMRKRNDAKNLLDSTDVANEVFDMVVVANDALNREGGKNFAKCLSDVSYTVNRMMNDPETADATFVALGVKFSSLGLEDMKLCCKETKFFHRPELGVAVFQGSDLPKAMTEVVRVCKEMEMITDEPKIGYNDSSAQLNFTTEFMSLRVQ